jgi:Fe-S cluster assembly iron-binding protein IscA
LLLPEWKKIQILTNHVSLGIDVEVIPSIAVMMNGKMLLENVGEHGTPVEKSKMKIVLDTNQILILKGINIDF